MKAPGPDPYIIPTNGPLNPPPPPLPPLLTQLYIYPLRSPSTKFIQPPKENRINSMGTFLISERDNKHLQYILKPIHINS